MSEEIAKTIKVLQSGGTILYPTDTIWGLGCDATNQKAVDKIYRIKRRIEGKSLLVLVDSFDRINDYVDSPDPVVLDLMQSFGKPLTIIYPNAKNVARGVAAADHTIGIRVVQDEFCRQVIAGFGKAIVSTSANISGDTPPMSFKQISREIPDSVDYTVGLYHDRIAATKPSSIIRILPNGLFEIVRA